MYSDSELPKLEKTKGSTGSLGNYSNNSENLIGKFITNKAKLKQLNINVER